MRTEGWEEAGSNGLPRQLALTGEGERAGGVGRGICQRSAPGRGLSSVFAMRIAKVPKCFSRFFNTTKF